MTEKSLSVAREFDRNAVLSYSPDFRTVGAKKKIIMDASQRDCITTTMPSVTGLTGGAFNLGNSSGNVIFQCDLSSDAQLMVDMQASAVCFDIEIGRALIADIGYVDRTIPLTADANGVPLEGFPWFLGVFLDNFTMSTSDTAVPLVNYAGQSLLSNLEARMYMNYSKEALARESFVLCNKDGQFLEETYDTAELMSEVTKQRMKDHFLTNVGSDQVAAAAHPYVFRRRVRFPLSFLVGAFDRPYWSSAVRKIWMNFTLKNNDDILWRHFASNGSIDGHSQRSTCRPFLPAGGGGTHRIVCNVVGAEMQIVQVRLNPAEEVQNVELQKTNQAESYAWMEQYSLKTLYSNTSQVFLNATNNLQSVMFGWKCFDISSPAVQQPISHYAVLDDAQVITDGTRGIFLNPMQYLGLNKMVPVETRPNGAGNAWALAYGNVGNGARNLSILIGSNSYPLRPMLFTWRAVPNAIAGGGGGAFVGANATAAAAITNTPGQYAQALMHYQMSTGWVGKKLGTPVLSLQNLESCYGLWWISTRDAINLAETPSNQRTAIQMSCDATQGPTVYVQGRNMTCTLCTVAAASVYADGSATVLKAIF
jgi:hypothetical protein